MRVRWLGWAAVEVQAGDTRIVIDPLKTPDAVFAAAGDAAAGLVVPELADAGEGVPAAAALVTHLHRDHADADALTGALAAGAPVYAPAAYPAGGELADLGIAPSRAEFAAAGITPTPTQAWERFEIGELTVTALPAADGTGDPQLSWAIEGDGQRILHCGDTLFHGWWWRMAMYAGPFDVAMLPINGAVVGFPWRRPASPLPAVLDAEQAVVAARVLGARVTVPIHYGGFDLEPFYRSDPDALERFDAAAEREGINTVTPGVGEEIGAGAV